MHEAQAIGTMHPACISAHGDARHDRIGDQHFTQPHLARHFEGSPRSLAYVRHIDRDAIFVHGSRSELAAPELQALRQ
jgi:hypothetical protein